MTGKEKIADGKNFKKAEKEAVLSAIKHAFDYYEYKAHFDSRIMSTCPLLYNGIESFVAKIMPVSQEYYVYIEILFTKVRAHYHNPEFYQNKGLNTQQHSLFWWDLKDVESRLKAMDILEQAIINDQNINDMDTYVERCRQNSIRERIKVGATLYIVPKDTRHPPFEAEVLKIGRKYIELGGLHRTENKFSIVDLCNVCDDGNSNYKLYASKEDYEACNNMQQEIDYLMLKIKTGLLYMSPDILQKILKIVDDNLVG